MTAVEHAGFEVFLLLLVPTTGWPLLCWLVWRFACLLKRRFLGEVYTVEVEFVADQR